MAKTTTISISSDTTREEIGAKIEAAKPKAGDTLRFSILGKDYEWGIIALVLLIIFYRMNKTTGNKARQLEGTDILNDLFGSQKSMQEVEAEIEREFGVNLEFDIQQSTTKNDIIEKAAGIWADDDISLEEIRTAVWPKRNW